MHAYVHLVLYIFRLLLDLLASHGLSDGHKEIEILLLRHQLRILQRKLPSSKPPRISVWEKSIREPTMGLQQDGRQTAQTRLQR
jgi:hypothetical protein